MKIAVLDNGIDESYLHCPVRHLDVLPPSSGIRSDPHGSSDSRVSLSAAVGHGTVCAMLIEQYGRVEEMTDVRCIFPDGRSSLRLLNRGLSRCLTQCRPDVINISAGAACYDGLSEDVKELKRLCRECRRRGIMIFAAQSSGGMRAVPACLEDVLSVDVPDLPSSLRGSICRPSGLILHGKHRILSAGRQMVTSESSSFACAFACGLYSKSILMQKYAWRRLRKRGTKKVPLWKHLLWAAGRKTEIPVLFICSGNAKDSRADALALRRLFVQKGVWAELFSGYVFPSEAETFAAYAGADLILCPAARIPGAVSSVLIRRTGFWLFFHEGKAFRITDTDVTDGICRILSGGREE